MTAAATRVPHQPQAGPQEWFSLIGSGYGFIGSDMVGEAVYHNGKTYIGVVDGDSNVRVASYSHSSRAVAVSPAIVTIIPDIHVTPSVLVRSSDSKLVVAASAHAATPAAHMYIAISTNAEDVSAWGAATDIKTSLGATNYTYPKLIQLSGESGKIYLFYRDEQDTNTTSALCYSTSTDGGSTWAAQTVLYKNTSHQAYWAIDSDQASRIDFIASDGSASAGDTTPSLYHFYYDGSFKKSDGTAIGGSAPHVPADLTKIYDGATNGGVRVPYSVIVGPSPYAAWAAWDTAGSGSNEHYWYGTCNSGGTWTVNQIADAGSPPTGQFSEGGLCLDRTDSTKVFVSREQSGYFQVVLYATVNSGSSWSSATLTSDTGVMGDCLNLRPISPRNADASLRAIWCFGPHYIDTANTYERSSGQIRGYPNPASVL